MCGGERGKEVICEESEGSDVSAWGGRVVMCVVREGEK